MAGNRSAALNAAWRAAKIEVLGIDDIKNDAQAAVGIALLQSFGDAPAGFLFFEPCVSGSSRRPPDVLLCHPDAGVLVIEVKGFPIGLIERISAGSLFVKRGGFVTPENPFQQASDQMFDVKHAVERILRASCDLPLFEFMVAFPSILSSDWERAGYAECLDREHLLFADDLAAGQFARSRIERLVAASMSRARLAAPLIPWHVETVRAAFGDSAVINARRPVRHGVNKEKLGHYVDQTANLEKYLSAEQQELSRIRIDGFPRVVRGVAGSGKSIVLANMVAAYVSREGGVQKSLFSDSDRDPTVGVICFNRALVPFLQARIRDSYRAKTLENPPADRIVVKHLNGLMYHLCRERHWPIEYIHVNSEDGEEAALRRALRYAEQVRKFAAEQPDAFAEAAFDALFIDEGQDVLPEEYLLLQELVKRDPGTDEKPLMIFYDDAQNLYGRTRPVWKQLGIEVGRGDRTRIMKECFRNTREIVEFGFNVLLGACAPEDARVATRSFADLSYLKDRGLVEEKGGFFKVGFAERRGQPPAIRVFETRERERRWLAGEVRRLIAEESVRPEDILILFHRSDQYRGLADELRTSLGGLIHGVLQPFGDSPDKDSYIFRPGHLTVSTTHGAKGYDAPVAFVAGADLFDSTNEGRASFYVGITRAKLLLYVTGVDSAGGLVREARDVAKYAIS